MLFETLIFFPLLGRLKRYNLQNLRKDLIAGVNVALLALPQSLAYAFMANLPLSCGVFSAIFGTIFTASFGASRTLVSGPTNTSAILLLSGTTEVLFTFFRDVEGVEREMVALHILTQIVLLVGIFQLLAGFFGLGRIIRFVSRPVVIGYVLAAAFAILINQLYPFFGIKREVNGASGIQAWVFLLHFTSLHLPTAILSISTLAALFLLKRFFRKLPAAVVVLFCAALGTMFFQHFFSFSKQIEVVADLGQIYNSFPRFSVPFFDFYLMTKLVPFAFALSLLSILEATTIGQSYHRIKRGPYCVNQEIYGLGVSNVFVSFLALLPSSGSFSRSHLNFISGAQTQFAAIFSGLFVLLSVVFLEFYFGKIPLGALSALMVVTAFGMVRGKELLLCLRATSTDAWVVSITFIASLIVSLEIALYIGVIIAIIFFLRSSSLPDFVEYGFNSLGKLRPIEKNEGRDDEGIAIIQPEGELFFASASSLQSKLYQLSLELNLKVVILQLINTRKIDASVCLSLIEAHSFFTQNSRVLLLAGVAPEVTKILQQSGLFELIGKHHIFFANDQLPGEPTREAYALAKNLCGF